MSDSALPPRYAKRRAPVVRDEAIRAAKRRRVAEDSDDGMDVDPEDASGVQDARSQDTAGSPLKLKTYRKEVLQSALTQNTIALLPSSKQTPKILRRFVRHLLVDEPSSKLAGHVQQDSCIIFLVKNGGDNSEDAYGLAEVISHIEEPATILSLTPQIFLDKLSSSAFAITQALAIVIPEPQVFDHEATQALEEIIDDFYRPSAPSLRPLILATIVRASRPWLTFDQQIIALEHLLECRTHGFTDRLRQEVVPNHPVTEVVYYEPSPQPPDTPLITKLREACSPAPTLFCYEHVAHLIAYIANGMYPALQARVITGNVDRTTLVSTFRDYDKGTTKLLIATESAMDMDFTKASLVVQLDLFDSYVSYAYSMAHSSKRLVLLAAQGKPMHRRIIEGLTQREDTLSQWAKTLTMKSIPIPPIPSLLEEPSKTRHVLENEEADKNIVLTCAATGGYMNPHDAVKAVFAYAATLHVAHNFTALEIHRTRQTEHMGFICTVHLPGSPASEVEGPVAPSRWEARRAACALACTILYKHSLIHSRHFRHHRIPGEGALAYSKPTGGASGTTFARRKAAFWGISARTPQKEGVYPVVIECVEREGPERYRPLLLLTRHPLPDVPTIRVYEVPNVREVRMRRAKPLDLSDAQHEVLARYTERIVRAVLNKELTCASGDMLWTVAPLQAGWQLPSGDLACDVSSGIDWASMEASVAELYVSIKRGSPDELATDMEDAVVQGRRSEMTRRYFFMGVRRDLTPLSKPADSPREALYENIFEFARSASRDLKTLEDFNQPLIEVERIPQAHNCLTLMQGPPDKGDVPAKYMIPELCFKITIPASVMRTALLLPSVLTRIDEIFLVKELNAIHFNHIIAEDLLHAALTTPSAGFDRNYERLELYGDAFLKYLASLHLFVMSHHNDSEGKLHAARRPLISNQKLMECSLALGLPSFVIGKPFVIRFWAPANFRMNPPGGSAEKGKEKEQGKVAETPPPASDAVGANQGEGGGGKKRRKKKKGEPNDGQIQQMLSDKALADVVEAILGAAHLSAGRDGGLQVAKALGLPVAKNADIWDDFKAQVSMPATPSAASFLRPGTVDGVQSVIGQKLNKPELLALALTHANNSSPLGNYERIEFLGDALLDFQVVEYVYRKYTQQPPSVLTLLKSAMVGNSPLAAICAESGLYRHLHQKSHQIQQSINTYLTALQKAKQKEYAAADDDLRERGQYWFDVNPPKALSDIVESIVGAIYISDDLEWTGVQQLFKHFLQPFYEKHIRMNTLAVHPTKILLELVQSQCCHKLELVKSASAGQTQCNVLLHGAVIASKTAVNGVLAARAASSIALNKLDRDPGLVARTCTCRTAGMGKAERDVDQFLSEFKA
ncbi:ribonuclease III [Schizophyllum commune Loenen D]|nr:ribonuclease III [Schizophyllum commune Loenen D]